MLLNNFGFHFFFNEVNVVVVRCEVVNKCNEHIHLLHLPLVLEVFNGGGVRGSG
jgi:hypothetical protein